jgi:hypothetical protein
MNASADGVDGEPRFPEQDRQQQREQNDNQNGAGLAEKPKGSIPQKGEPQLGPGRPGTRL